MDLTAIPLIDGHCHSILDRFLESTPETFLRIFTEATDPRIAVRHVPQTLTYRRALRDLAALLGCSASPEAILKARRETPAYLRALCREAGLQGILVDPAYPPGTLSLNQLQADLGCRVAPLFRLETAEEQLLATEHAFGSFEEGLRAAIVAAKHRGAVALKSIVAYRSGLDVRPTSRAQARLAFQRARAQVERRGTIRLAAKPLLDYCIAVSLDEAKRLELPIQFHTGFGDPDIDLLTANPALLRPIFENPAYVEVPIVLLHMGYPYVRQAAFLASVYPHVYVDVSLVVPLLQPILPDLLRDLLALAPATKILYGSDCHSQPEMLWLGARYGRKALGAVLGANVHDGTLTEGEAWHMAERILYRNALELYRLDAMWSLQDAGRSSTSQR